MKNIPDGSMRLRLLILSAVFCVISVLVKPARAGWATSVQLPYNAPAYVAQWAADNEVIVFTMTNHSDAPVPIVLGMTLSDKNGVEVFHGTSVPFLMPNNNPRAVRSPELIRWKQIVWSPLFRRSCANAGRLPEGDINVCVEVYAWNNGMGEKLSEACGKTYVNYPDVPKLAKPGDDAHLTAIPLLAWQRPNIPDDIPLHYMIQIADIAHGTAPDAALAQALKEKTVRSIRVDGLSYQLTSDVLPLRYGGSYAWRVVALDRFDNPATTHNGESRAQTFSFDPMNENQKLRIVTLMKKSASDLLNAASSQGTVQSAVVFKLVKDKLPGASLAQSFEEISKSLSTWIDSLARQNAAPELLNNVIGAQFAVGYCADLTEGKYPLAGATSDSLLALCIARAKGLRSAATGMETAPADSLVRRLTAIRTGMGEGVRHADLAAIAENFSWLYTSKESDLQTSLLKSVEGSFTAFLQQTWRSGAYLADAASQAQTMQANAPKNAQAAVSQINDKIISAMKHMAAAESGGGSMAAVAEEIKNVGDYIESLHHMKGAQGQAIAAITDNLDGLQSDISFCLKSVSGAQSSQAASGVSTADILPMLNNISVSKKGMRELNKAVEICNGAGSDPAAQSSALNEIEATVRSLMKSEKNKEGMQAIVDKIESAKAVGAQSSFYNNAADMAASAGKTIKDQMATMVCKAIAENCRADAADASAHPFSPGEAVWRAQNIIRDAEALDAIKEGHSALAAQVAPMLEANVIAPNLMNDPAMQDAIATMRQKGVTSITFGATNNNTFAEVNGSAIVLNVVLGDQPIPVLKYFIALGLNAGTATTLEGMYDQSNFAAGVLMQNRGDGMNTRADFSLDLKTLGEQEAKCLFRAMPAYLNVVDH